MMEPGGESETALKATAQHLQSKGRNGDTILAHISPKEARMLKKKGGAGTVHPVTGLLEFSDDAKKEGKYIWRTVGDGKVRSAHADRDGKVFSWDDPPEGGHPGEAYNCRCQAEPVQMNCKELQHKIDNQEIAVQEAEKERDQLQEKLEAATKLQNSLQEKCDKALEDIAENGLAGGISGLPGGWWGAVRGAGEAVITSTGDSYEACLVAADQMEKVNELTKRRNLSMKWVKEQRAILKGLRNEFTDTGCDP